MERIMRFPEVLDCTGYKKTSIYKMMSKGNFPKQVRLGMAKNSAVGWRQSEIKEWIDSK